MSTWLGWLAGSLADGGRSQESSASLIVRAPINHGAARTRHPDAVAVDRGVELALSLMLLEEGVERGQQHHASLVDSTFNASHSARCAACHGVRSQAVPIALVGECSMPVV